jgi:hypothetical protein
VFSVRYELGFYIQENGKLHSHRCENLKFYAVNVSFLHQLTSVCRSKSSSFFGNMEIGKLQVSAVKGRHVVNTVLPALNK